MSTVSEHCDENPTDEQCACLLASQAFAQEVEEHSNRQARISEISADLSAKETEYNTTDGLLNEYDRAWEAMKYMPARRNKVVVQPAKKCEGTVVASTSPRWGGESCQVAYDVIGLLPSTLAT